MRHSCSERKAPLNPHSKNKLKITNFWDNLLTNATYRVPPLTGTEREIGVHSPAIENRN